MAQEVSNLRMRACEVFFNEESLGHTNGGVEVEVVRTIQDMKVDKYGDVAVDKVIVGNRLKVKVILAEWAKSILRRAIPEGVYTVVGADSKIGIGRVAGDKLSQYAALLRLHPFDKTSSDHNEDLYVFKAVSAEPVTLPYKNDEQNLIEVTFESLVDESQANGTLLGRIGDIDVS